MNLKLDGAYHWFSTGSFALTLGMICAGQTVLEPSLAEGSSIVSVLYWSLCAAFGVASAAFAYLGVMQARHQLDLLESRMQVQRVPASGARFSPIKKKENIDA